MLWDRGVAYLRRILYILHMENKVSLASLRKQFGCDVAHVRRLATYLGLSLVKEGRSFYFSKEDAEAIRQLKTSMSARELQRKMTEATLERRWGDKHYNNRSLMRQTKLDHFGSAEALRSSIKQKRLATVAARYGVDPNSLDWKKAKCLATVQERFGVDNPLQLASTKAARIAKVNLAMASRKGKAAWAQHRKELRQGLEKDVGSELVGVKELSESIVPGGVDFGTLHHNISRLKIQRYHLGNYTYITQADAEILKQYYETTTSLGVSAEEKELAEYVRSLGDFEVQENMRGIISGNYELDIYIPSKQVAIEFNGCYWHSDKAMCRVDEVPSGEAREKARTRHLLKSRLCKEKGIRCIHVWEQDWVQHPSAVKAMIAHALGRDTRSVFARKCEIVELPLRTYREFLETNHLQGYSFADVRLGLQCGNELVMAMGIHARGTHSANPEMVRLCSKNFVIVPGGFSKLLHHVDRCYNFEKIVSYVDRSMFEGKGYEKVGFQVAGVNPPTFSVVKSSHATVEPRWKYMKCRLKAMFEQGLLKYYNDEETEAVNLYKNGYALVWNCGTIRVERARTATPCVRGLFSTDSAARAEVFALMDKNALP